jgi:putative ABC transport system permease protein
MYFNKEYVEQSLPERRRRVATGTVFWVLIDKPAEGPRIAATIDGQFRNSTAQTKTESEQAFLVGFLSVLGNVKAFLIAISASLAFTILLVSANTVAMSVRERTREVGILRTLGFTPGAILNLILTEALGVALLGGTVGYLISTGLLQTMIKSPFAAYLPPLHAFEPAAAAACILGASALGLASALPSAMGVARISVVDALRSTD